MTEQENDITQPVPLKPAPSADMSEEDTQPVNVAPESQKNPLPEWLLKFAAAPEQPEEPQVSPKTIPVVFEEDENFIPPVLPEDSQWQEVPAFREQESAEAPADEAAEAPTNEVSEEPGTAESFGRRIRDLLGQGQRADAIAQIRANKSDPALVEAARKTLRSYLTLSENANELWEVYDELNRSTP